MKINRTSTAYEKPTAQVVGSIVELTQANKTGANLDASYPAGTPLGSVLLTS